ncbi:hypothetical protein HSBAA_13760 [Vreelandella sulfidaeris]|uniref:Gamma-glutamyltransferase n=1 Tax=Vreelandella sulfidaeris TaxID=115553 RepID=A0A455U242_9GAMM|nr:hypothetical protein HSBAA_13760 [Halomonas sulfidaeris]
MVEPTSNGIGSDAFAIVWVDGKLHGLNASGPAPQAATIEALKALGHEAMPNHGMLPVTVPGAPAAWAVLSERFGKLPFAELLAPAIALADEGFPVSPVIHQMWKEAFTTYSAYSEASFKPWFDTFAPGDRAPEAGELWRSEGHAKSLKAIADTHGKAFYEGELAEAIDAFSREHGGLLRKEDLAAYQPEWVDPISVRYKGHDIWEIPPTAAA